jgi:hypothetical protein
MKTSKTLIGLFAVASLFISGCQTPRTTTSAWEYKVIEKNLYPGDLQKQIDVVQQDGWEFVSISTTKETGSVPYGFIIVRKPKQ